MYYSLAAMISPLIGGLLFNIYGYKITFEYSMLITFIYFVIFLFFYSGFNIFKEDKKFRY